VNQSNKIKPGVNPMSFVISSGHGLRIRGASGYLDEVDQARKVVEAVATKLKASGVTVKTFHDDTSRDQSTNLKTIVNYHNAQSRDMDISVHFNAYQTTSKPMGTEVLYVTQQTKASELSKAICVAGGFVNRGGKKRTDLYFLNNTSKPSLLIETCFVDSSADRDLYNKNFDAICTAIAQNLSGKKPPAPIEPPVEPPVQPPVEPPVTEVEDRVDITSVSQGNVLITFNGEDIVIGTDPSTENYVKVTIEANIPVTINGQDFHEVGPSPTPPDPTPPDPPVPPSDTSRPTIRNGSYGNNVREVQTSLSVSPVDGNFGPQTGSAVKSYQASVNISDDGVVGPQTWSCLSRDFSLPYYPPKLPNLFSDTQLSTITDIAMRSPIASYNWSGRGKAPAGYIKGMAVAYAQAFTRFTSGDPIANEMAKANTGNDSVDAISWYNSNFSSLGMSNSVSGIDTLRHLYVLMLGLGMRESSGQYCCGRDQSASNTDSNTCEAGLFQTSWNASSCCTDFINLFDQYSVSSPQGYKSIFSEGVSCSSANWKSYGTGDGYNFQEICKWSPTFAVETAAIGLRNLRQHWGPINRKEAELRKDADDMFQQVEGVLGAMA
jgi:hypothetical protein